MKRKVIKQGPTTLMISLPARWVQKYAVAKGDTLNVEQVEKALMVTTDKPIDTKPVEFDTAGLDSNSIKKYLNEIYKAGYNEVMVFYEDPKIVSQIQEIINTVLIGFEIVNQHTQSLTVKSISETMEQEFDSILRRVFLVTKQLSINSLDIIRKGNYTGLKDVLVLEDTNDKLSNFCQRVLNKKGYKKFSKTPLIYCLVWQLEEIADEYKYIGEYLIENPNVKLSKETLELYESVNTLFNDFYDLFYDFDKDALTRFSKKATKLINQGLQLQAGSRSKQDIVISHLTSLTNMIFNLLNPFIGTIV